jgi:hypothetical protein
MRLPHCRSRRNRRARGDAGDRQRPKTSTGPGHGQGVRNRLRRAVPKSGRRSSSSSPPCACGAGSIRARFPHRRYRRDLQADRGRASLLAGGQRAALGGARPGGSRVPKRANCSNAGRGRWPSGSLPIRDARALVAAKTTWVAAPTDSAVWRPLRFSVDWCEAGGCQCVVGLLRNSRRNLPI